MQGYIYQILNKKTKHFYIGSTITLNRRWKEHRNDLKKNIHHSKYLQRSYNKHGVSEFEYIILANCPKEYLKKLEQWFLDHMKPKYNMAKDAIRPMLGRKISKEEIKRLSKLHTGNTYLLGRKATESTKSKMTNIRKGKTLSKTTRVKLSNIRKGNPILQLSKDNTLIKEYLSITDASKSTGIPRQTISQVCRGEYETGYGYKWKYKKKKNKNNRPIIDINTGTIYNSIKECSEKLNIHRNSINNSLNNRSKSYKNLKYINQ